MPRRMRTEYPGATCRVMDPGDRREDNFVNDVDCQGFLKTLAEACQKTGWQVHAYCLMQERKPPCRSSGLARG
jgi:putative transposase